MADPEMLTALKKAYADTILNTAKEAAARVMVSERKAHDYQQELVFVREEAVRMLLRLKQMFDSKVREAETASLSKQKKIEELEAQLGEAEDIVEELRTELRELQYELEKATKIQIQHLEEQNTNQEAGEAQVSLPNVSLDAPNAIISSLPVEQNESVTVSDTKNPISSGMCDFGRCSCKDNGYSCRCKLPSIVRRCQELQLYRNGCTQRIRALERNIDDGNLSFPGKVDDVNHGEFTGEEDGRDINIKPTQDAVEVHAFNSSHERSKRSNNYTKKPKSQFSRSFSDSDSCRMSGHSDVTNFPSSAKDHFKTGEEDPRVTKNRSENRAETSFAMESRTQENAVYVNSRTGIETVSSNAEASGLTEETCVLPGDKAPIKYTFKRKRKKESSRGPDGNSSIDGEKEHGLTTESPRDSRRLAQVAHQLVSLSEKKRGT